MDGSLSPADGTGVCSSATVLQFAAGPKRLSAAGAAAVNTPDRTFTAIAFLAVAMFSGLVASAQSWIYPETISPARTLKDAARPDQFEFMGCHHFWAEGGIYTVARDDRHRWNATVGGAVELLGANAWNFVFETNLHLAVDPNNNMSFNPRALVWEEGLLLGRRFGSNIWHIGVQQRCKHDIDNVEVLRVTGREEERALIYSSAMLRWERTSFRISGIDFSPTVETHFYIFLQDQRFPVQTRSIGASVESYIGAVRFQLSASRRLSPMAAAGAAIDLRSTALGPSGSRRFSALHAIRNDWSAEAWLEAIGSAASLRLFLRYVEQPDDFITPVPQAASLLCIGFRVSPTAPDKDTRMSPPLAP